MCKFENEREKNLTQKIYASTIFVHFRVAGFQSTLYIHSFSHARLRSLGQVFLGTYFLGLLENSCKIWLYTEQGHCWSWQPLCVGNTATWMNPTAIKRTWQPLDHTTVIVVWATRVVWCPYEQVYYTETWTWLPVEFTVKLIQLCLYRYRYS